MSIMLTGSVKERRHASTMNIDRLSTLDMLKVIHQDDALISAAITPVYRRLPAWWITPPRRSVTAVAWSLSARGRQGA
jgi:hypothetical protein